MHVVFRRHGIVSQASLNRCAFALWFGRLSLAGFLATTVSAHADGVVHVSDAGAPSPTTCTLAQAIATANVANNSSMVGANIGSATANLGICGNPPSFPAAGLNTLLIDVPVITLTTIDNYWYGPNALPPIASAITIVASSGTGALVASHVGDPAPVTANAFRLFYVSGGLAGELPAGSLTIVNMILQGGNVKGGDSDSGGGGAGMGGAIFNQGVLSLTNVSLIGHSARGGSINDGGSSGGGGIGQDATNNGGGFGGSIGSGWGGGGSNHAGAGGGGGGGFSSSAAAAAGNNGGAGGGNSALGAVGGDYFVLGNLVGAGGAAGDGGGGAGGDGGVGGDGGGFGFGGSACNFACGGGGGGVGGGGGKNGGGGGFGGGGGGGEGGGNGGFGGGHGYHGSPGPVPGFGGGYIPLGGVATGGAGMGGAIFNDAGAVFLLNVTASYNAANGGSGSAACNPACNGSGLGAVLFNLNGNVTIDFSTLAGNFLAGNNGLTGDMGPEDATVYSLAFGNKIADGSFSSASLTINNSIVHGTHADGGAGNDVLANVVDGAQPNSSSVVYKGKNFVQFSTNLGSVTQTGSSPTQADPLLGSLSIYGASTAHLPVLPIGSNSPAYNTAPSCLKADLNAVGLDERGATRPQFAQCDVGAYEFDGDYIFADGVDVKL